MNDLLNVIYEKFESIPLPSDYLFEERPEEGQYNDKIYEMIRKILQKKLDGIKNTEALGLSAVLKWLYKQQLDIGFIQDDLTQVQYFSADNADHKHFFSGQFNPRRIERTKGAGRQITPKGVKTQKIDKEKSDVSCFLCTDNVRWQQRGIQLYYHHVVNGNKYNILCNPFPFMPVHMTIASDEHEPQTWHEFVSTKEDKSGKIRRITADLYELSTQLRKGGSNFIGFYNGLGAGATIEKHLHYHFFTIPDGHPENFPLQRAAQQAIAHQVSDEGIHHLKIEQDFYPLIAFRLYGKKERVIETVVNLANQWDRLVGDSASANIVSLWENETQVIYFIPRNKFFSRAPGMAGMIGGCEALGEFIFSTEWENEAINQQKVNYSYMWHILQSVRPPRSNVLAVHVPEKDTPLD